MNTKPAFDDIFRLLTETKTDMALDVTYLHGYAKGLARWLFFQDHRLPMLWIVGYPKTGGMHILETRVRNDFEKQLVYKVMRNGMDASKAYLFSHISEAWQATVDHDTDPAVAKLRPVQRSDRREVVVVSTRDRAGAGRFTRMGIDRPMDGKPPGLGLDEDDDTATCFAGDLWNLLE